MFTVNKSKTFTQIAVVYLIALISFWSFNKLTNQPPGGSLDLAFGAIYGLMALLGAIYGLITAKQWGGLKSSLGLVTLCLAAGLAFAEFGQLIFSYYNIISKVEIPYPSLADVGFFGNIPLYILACFYLAKTVGVQASMKKIGVKLLALLLPLVLIGAAYKYFLSGYEFADVGKLTVFLDFGYPIGQAVYVSFALFILLATSNRLGGLMRSRILLILFAFFAQFAADFNFLYQTKNETWTNGGYGDVLYLLAYFLMTISLIRLSAPFKTVATTIEDEVK